MSKLRSLHRERSGVTAVEFGIILPAMLTLICGSLEVSHMIFARVVLDGAVVEAARTATASLETAEFERTEAMRNSITRTMAAFPVADGKTISIDTKVYRDFNSVREEEYNDADNDNKYDLGEPFEDRNQNDQWDASAPIDNITLGSAGQVVSYTASYPKKILFGFLAGSLGFGTSINLSSTTVVRNESVVRRVT